MRVRNKIKPDVEEKQYSYLEPKGTTNTIYIHQSMIERAVDV